MDEYDKIYLWMVVATFAALCMGILFAVLEKQDLVNTTVQALTYPT
jgi:hypothetical protein